MEVRRGGVDGFTVTLPALALPRGEVAALTGQSGCGKSTLLEMIGAILRPDTLGAYRLHQPDVDIAAPLMAADEAAISTIRSRELGFVLQHGGLLPWLTVLDNIVLPRRLAGMDVDSHWLNVAIERLGITQLLKKMPAQLSIGERQRVAFVRAIAHQPRLLLADEPTAALDPDNARRLFALIVDMVRALDMVAIIVSHDWQLVDSFGLRSYRASIMEGRSVFCPA
ncbi:ATP-binding cassette domain-containing protein [Cedecea davisae]|uniref:ATP-binding cassette domain-containing protein n=2 Tax=Cedecea davisae TaxID=158484 RepID=A0ABS6DGM1_9ENTR|nr:ATP-binding cassette domain-containing protein [Cedecea davisae]MBU4688456.1 ATP-binding cassette domain-containing protein [Cedecea davisae]